MVLADPEEVRPNLVGKDTFFDDIADRFGVGERPTVIVVGDITEGVKAEDEWEVHCFAGGCLYPV